MTEPERWLLSGCIIAFLLILGALLDGPSDTEAQRAVAADLRDAQAQARRSAHHARAEQAMRVATSASGGRP
jgi:hypothetical protein